MRTRGPGFVATSAARPPASTAGARRVLGGATLRRRDALALAASSTSTLPASLTSVKVFDGSEVADAVVRSDAFWSTLASQLPYLILAQLLAAATFLVIAGFATAQGASILDRALPQKNEKVKFRRAPPRLDLAKLLVCLCIDAAGAANEALPLVGELADVVYAPLAAALLREMFSGSNVVFLLELAEEILPFTDVLPLASICWVVESFFGDSGLAQALRIGRFAPSLAEEDQDTLETRGGEKDDREK